MFVEIAEELMLELSEYLKITIGLLVIVDPLTAIPLFVTLTGRDTERHRKEIAGVASLATALIFLGTIVMGQSMLRFFGISIASFKVGGGILLLFMALEMLQARQILSKHTPEEDREAVDRTTIAVVPLAVPLLAGPGAISAIIIYAGRSASFAHYGMLGLCCLAVVLAIWISLRAATRLSVMMGRTGINIAIRLMGMIVAAISVEFVTAGLAELLPGLA